MTKQEKILETIRVLKSESEVLSSRVKSAGTGYLITAIDVINSRIDELVDEVTCPYWKDENGDIGRLPGQTRSSHLRSIEDAFAQKQGPIDRTAVTKEEMSRFYNNGPHIGASRNLDGTWDMSAAARMATDDDVEHTKEYYTGKDRNRGAMSTSDAEALGD